MYERSSSQEKLKALQKLELTTNVQGLSIEYKGMVYFDVCLTKLELVPLFGDCCVEHLN